MITYNHEKFISQAIESVMTQETSFRYELVIGEDCSTDRTRELCIEYQQKYPGKIRLLLRDENLGMMQNFVQTLHSCEGQYIALLEGDDYWTSPHKLQQQVDFLDRYPDFSICSHNAEIKYEGRTHPYTEWLGAQHKEVLTLEDLLRDGSGGATCSLVYRNGVFGDFPDWYSTVRGGDWSLQVLCASHGKMRYFREVMGVFRHHDRGSLYSAIMTAKAREEELIALPSKNSLYLCDILDKHFNYRYGKLLKKQKAYWYWVGAVDYGRYGKNDQARAYFFKALPVIVRLPHWLDFRTLLASLAYIFFPPSLVRILHLVKSLGRK